MAALVWTGATMTGVGLAGLLVCIVIAARARSAGLEGAAMEARLRRLVPLNLGALAVSTLGLMLVIAGIFLT